MFKDFPYISEQNPAVALALVMEPIESPIFTGYQNAKSPTLNPMPKALINKLHEFGFDRIVQAFIINGLKAMTIVFDLQSDSFITTIQREITYEQLKLKESFNIDQVEWCVFASETSKNDVTGLLETFYCAPASQIE